MATNAGTRFSPRAHKTPTRHLKALVRWIPGGIRHFKWKYHLPGLIRHRQTALPRILHVTRGERDGRGRGSHAPSAKLQSKQTDYTRI